jgi:hypothetical protein
VAEANALGTAWLRFDLLPADTQPRLKEAFRKYTDSRIAVYRTFSKGGVRCRAGGVCALDCFAAADLDRLALVLSFTFYVILDFEYPRLGFIRIDDFDNLLVQVRASMG